MLRHLYAGALTALVTVAGTACSDNNNNPTVKTNFMATLTGASVMPTPVTTTASGTTALVLNDNASTIDYTVTVQNLTGATAVFIYAGSSTDVPGTPVAVLLSAPVTGTTNGQLTAGTIAAAALGNGETYTTFAAKIRAGNAFVVIQTVANPGGELRGQLQAQ